MLYLQDLDISVFGAEELLQWAEQSPQEGPRTLSRLCGVTGPNLSPLARELLVRYGKDKRVRSNLAANFTSGIHMGSTTYWLQAKVQIAKAWADDPHPNVRLWANELVRSLEQEIVHWRQWEEEEGLP